MLTRVRRGDVALAAIATVGLTAGVALTIATKLGAPGPILIAVGVVAALAAAINGIRGQLSGVVRRQRLQQDRLEAILSVPIGPIGDVNPFMVGVFHSRLAEKAQSNSAVEPTGVRRSADSLPPYVSRRIDEKIRGALDESSLNQTRRLVVLRGDPKCGKSRSLWEAIRLLDHRKLLAVIQPDPTGEPSEPAFAPLATLVGLDRPVSRSKGSDLVILVDDAQTHLRRGLTRDNLRRLADMYPDVVVALTIHSSDLDALSSIDPPLHGLLRRSFDDLILESVLSKEELADARIAYPSLADEEDLVRLPELFAAVNLLTDRYQLHRIDQPAGVAVAKAVID